MEISCDYNIIFIRILNSLENNVNIVDTHKITKLLKVNFDKIKSNWHYKK